MFLALFFCQLASNTILAGRAFAEGKKVEKDIDGDGKIDQIVFFDVKGKIERLEIDSNKDGLMDRFQYYRSETLVRIERDTDLNQRIDCRDFFDKGKRTRQERISESNKVYRITLFDENEQPFLMKKDSSDNGNFDTLYYFKEGNLVSSTRDTDENGKVNVWQKYKDNKPVEQKVDNDEDGRFERIVLYDTEGLPKRSSHDIDKDGKFETFRFYQKGELVKQQKDADLDGIMDSVTSFKDTLPIDRKKDSNLDKEFDIFTTFKNGKPLTRNKDKNFD
ncbi:MAG: hypothetical protein KAJ45_05750, partial [Desulfobulbaceae bacterium]|nr:hypothetical protein [Desulfobulbaceae bacterium]